MRFSTSFAQMAPNILEHVEWAKLIEKLGVYEGLYVPTGPSLRDCYTFMTLMAVHTKKLKLGFAIESEYLRHPIVHANSTAVLDEVSNGRAVLGIGPGDKHALQVVGENRPHPLVHIKESVHIIRKLLEGEAVTFEGEFFHINGFKLDNPPKHKVPIYVGARGPKMLELAGQIGDGVVLDFVHPKDIGWAMGLVKKGAEKVGRDIEQIDIVPYVNTGLSNDAKAAKNASKFLATMTGATQYDFLYKRHGIDVEKDVMPIRKLLEKGKFFEASQICPDILLDTYTSWGTPEKVLEDYKKIEKLGIKHAIFFAMGPDVPVALKLFAEKIAPHFE